MLNIKMKLNTMRPMARKNSEGNEIIDEDKMLTFAFAFIDSNHRVLCERLGPTTFLEMEIQVKGANEAGGCTI